jgi:hypothetical protein
MRTLGLATLIFCAAAGTKPSIAMESPKVFRGILILEGNIEPGDYTSVRNFLRDESNFKKISGGVFLASPGGHVLEAMKIGLLIRQLQLSTDAPSSSPSGRRAFGSDAISATNLVNRLDDLCTSACFLIYIAGIYRNLNWAGRLGIHEPLVKYKPIGASENDVKVAKIQMRNEIKRYFDKMNVPEKYADLMYSVPPNEVRWITQEEFDRDLRGYIPEIKALLESKCNSHGLPEQSDVKRKCIARTTAKLSTESWHKMFDREKCARQDCRAPSR